MKPNDYSGRISQDMLSEHARESDYSLLNMKADKPQKSPAMIKPKKPNFEHFSIETSRVCRFVERIARATFPLAVFGSEANLQCFLKCEPSLEVEL